MLSGELVKDLVLVQCRPKEIIEYIQKLESEITENRDNMSKISDRLDRLLKLSQIKSPDWEKFTTTSATPFITYTTSGT